MHHKISCHLGHPLKRRRAPNEYECDVCDKDISTGKRFFDCRKCNYSVCLMCETTAAAEEPSEADVEELFNVFCEIHTTPVRAAQHTLVRCDICGELLSGLVLFHMTKKHEAMVESFLTSAVEELEGSVLPAEMGMLSMMVDGEAGTRDLTCFTPRSQLPLTYAMADLISGAIVDTTRSVNSRSLITDVGASASQVADPLLHAETTNADTHTFRREIWNLCGAAMSDDDACPRPRLCTEHFDLTVDDSQDEGLADDMHGCELARPCRTATLHRVMVGHTARRWPVRRRGTCDVRDTTPKYKENWIPTRREMQILGGRVGLFVEWADCIETGGGTLEEKRLEYRELLGEMAIYEEDLNGAELEQYTDLTTIAWWEHDETEDAERELRTLRDGARRLILHLLHMQNTAPPKPVRRSKRPARKKWR